METTKAPDTETIRISKMTQEERMLLRILSPEERKAALLQVAREKVQRKGAQRENDLS